MPVGARRSRTLFGLSAKREGIHRYTWWRVGIGVVATVGVALLPLTDTLRLDLWGGNHRWLGQPVDLVQAAKAFAFPFLAVNVLILVASRFLGRWLCGFVCPVGNLNRLAEWFQWRHRKSWRRTLGFLASLTACFLLAAITFGFWVDWGVFVRGSATAATLAGLFLGGMTLGLFAIVHGLGMRFCREYCPSGVYFALLGPDTLTGVELAHPEACTDCHACENVCPVDLHPRAMASGEERGARGLYPDGLTNFANCLRCGDCVLACEATTAGNETPVPLRLGVLPRSARGPSGGAPGGRGEHGEEPGGAPAPARAAAERAREARLEEVAR